MPPIRRAIFLSGLAAILVQPLTTPAPVAAQTAAGKTEIFDFENATVGIMPSRFTAALTGGGNPIKWTIVEDATSPSGAKVLTEISADVTDFRFPLAILDSIQARDVELRVRFKAVAGQIDQAAGLVARLKDKDNYYTVRANALEDNIGLYKVVGGPPHSIRRRRIPGAAGALA